MTDEKEVLEEETTEEVSESKKSEVEEKVKKQIEAKEAKREKLGIYRISEYLKEEHKWEIWLFLAVSIITLLLGCLILNGALAIRSDFPVLGQYSSLFGWILVVVSALGLLYALYPFFKPAFPEFKKITWLKVPEFIGNVIRAFVFMLVFIALFILYDYFMTSVLKLIF